MRRPRSWRDCRNPGAAHQAAAAAPPGSTLAETLVALLLVGVAVASLGGAAAAASAMLREAALEQGAVLTAEGVLDSLAAESDAQPGELIRGPWSLEWIVADSAGSRLIDLEVRYGDGGTERRLRFGLRSTTPPMSMHESM